MDLKRKKYIVLIVIFGCLIYFNSLFNDFVWDDEEQIIHNSLVHSIVNIPTFFKGSTFNPAGAESLPGLYYKPLMTSLFSIIYSLFGPNPFYFHLFQIILHIINSILVFLIFKRLLKKERLSLFLSLIFLLHPINSESVLYISALQDVLFFLFGSLILLVVIKKTTFQYVLISSILLLLALLSKETAVLFVIIVFLYLLFFKKHKLTLFLLSLIPLLSIYATLRFVIAGIFFKKHGLTAISTTPLFDRIINIPKIIFYYIQTFFLPQNLAISQQWSVKTINFPDFFLPLIIDSILLSILIYFGFRLFRQNKQSFRIYFFFFLWFLFGLGFHLQIFPLDFTVSDRWFYFPQIGLLGMIGIVAIYFQNLHLKNTYLLLCAIILMVLSGRTLLRTFDWRNGYILYSHDVVYSKDSSDLEENLGVELARSGDLEKAKEHFEKAIQISPNSWTPCNNLGAYYERINDLKNAEKLYRLSIEKGNYYLAYENLASLLLREKRYDEVIILLEEALKIFPSNTKLILIVSLAYNQIGDYEKALKLASRLYQISQTNDNERLIRLIKNRKKINF